MKMTITEALAKLKLYEKKLDKLINQVSSRSSDTKFVDYRIGENKRGVITGKTEEELRREGQSFLDKYFALLQNFKKLKSAVAQSNALTKVTIAGKEYTVVEAIERKRSIMYEKVIIEALESQLSDVKNKVAKENERAKENLSRMLEAKLSSEAKNSGAKEIEDLAKSLFDLYEAKMIDPLELEKIVEKLTNDVEKFENEVDIALSIVNAKTMIDVDLDEA